MVDLNINRTIDKIHNLFCEVAGKKVSQYCYGYGCGIIPDNLEELIEDKKQLEKELIDSRLEKLNCLTKEESSNFLGKINKKLVNCGSSSSTLKINDSNYIYWLNSNPYCRVYESWEACENRINPLFKTEFVYRPVEKILDLALERKRVNLKLDLLSQNISEDILMKISSNLIKNNFEIKLNSERQVDDLVDFRISRKKIYFELISFITEYSQEYNLDISSNISKEFIELQILINSFDVKSDLELFITEESLSTNLDLLINKINSIQNLDILIQMFNGGILDITMYKKLLKSGCILEFNPISIRTKRDVYDIRAIKYSDGE